MRHALGHGLRASALSHVPGRIGGNNHLASLLSHEPVQLLILHSLQVVELAEVSGSLLTTAHNVLLRLLLWVLLLLKVLLALLLLHHLRLRRSLTLLPLLTLLLALLLTGCVVPQDIEGLLLV